MEYAGRASWDEVSQRERAWQDRLRQSEHLAFELTSTWTGWRMIGDVTWAGDAIGSVGIAHGLADPSEGPTIHVHTSVLPPGTTADSLLARAGLRLRNDPGTGATGIEFVPLDGVNVEADGSEVAAARGIDAVDGWLIEIPTDRATIYVEGHGLARDESLRMHGLRRVKDYEPLFAARLELLRRLRN